MILPPSTLVEVFDLPVEKLGKQTHIDGRALYARLSVYSQMLRLAVIEAPHSMPGQGVATTFTFGRACGVCEGVASCLTSAIIRANPATWKVAVGVSSDKGSSLSLVREMFPGNDQFFKRKKDHDRAEAVLLAKFGSRLLAMPGV